MGQTVNLVLEMATKVRILPSAPMEIGASFSHRHLKALGYDPLTALKEFKGLRFKWIRLGCYWDEIENEPGKFSFAALDPLVEYCQRSNINVLLTIGMKSPRFPEYYLPNWISKSSGFRRLTSISTDNKILLEATKNYLKHCVHHFKNNPIIKVWQVENEPLDWSGEKWWKITPEFLAEEISFVRKLDSKKRKILVNLWGNELTKRQLYKDALKEADILGLDLYLRHPMFIFFNFFNRYIGPLDRKEVIQGIFSEIHAFGKDVWLTELQAEPWEPGEIHTRKTNPPSFMPKHLRENLQYAMSLNPSVCLLWGFEWWYDCKQKGDLRYWEEAKAVIGSNIVN